MKTKGQQTDFSSDVSPNRNIARCAHGKPARRGRDSAIESLYVLHRQAVRGRCRRLLRNEEASRDATQEVFVKLMLAADLAEAVEAEDGRAPAEEERSRSWALRIATNHCINVLVAKNAPWHARYRRHAIVDHPAEEMAKPEVSLLVREILARFDPETQKLAIKYFVHDMTQAEVAAASGLSVPTVRKRLEAFRRTAHEMASSR